MKHLAMALLWASAAIVAAGAIGYQQQARSADPAPTAEPSNNRESKPAKPAEKKLLLLDDDEEEPGKPAGPVADNTRCHHCHLNYMDEELAVVHAEANIGCARCHGKCDAHIDDESWASGGNGTAPDIMYPRDKINPFCSECHAGDKIDKMAHKSFLAGTAKEKYCTDCHGSHRLTVRKCKWK